MSPKNLHVVCRSDLCLAGLTRSPQFCAFYPEASFRLGGVPRDGRDEEDTVGIFLFAYYWASEGNAVFSGYVY